MSSQANTGESGVAALPLTESKAQLQRRFMVHKTGSLRNIKIVRTESKGEGGSLAEAVADSLHILDGEEGAFEINIVGADRLPSVLDGDCDGCVPSEPVRPVRVGYEPGGTLFEEEWSPYRRSIAFAPSVPTLTGAAELVRKMIPQKAVYRAIFSPHNPKVLGLAEFPMDECQIRDWEQNKRVNRWALLMHTDPIQHLAFHPVHEHLIASCSYDKLVAVVNWRNPAHPVLLRGHTLPVNCVAFHPRTPHFLASASDDHTIRIWRWTRAGRIFCKPTVNVLRGHSQGVSSCVFDRTSALLASGSWDGTARMWAWEKPAGGMVKAVFSHPAAVLSVDLSGPDHPGLLATGCSDFQVRVWDVATNQCLATLEGHTMAVTSVEFCRDERLRGSRFVLSASYDRTARVWDWQAGACLRLCWASDWCRASWCPADPELVATAGGVNDDAAVRVFRLPGFKAEMEAGVGTEPARGRFKRRSRPSRPSSAASSVGRPGTPPVGAVKEVFVAPQGTAAGPPRSPPPSPSGPSAADGKRPIRMRSSWTSVLFSCLFGRSGVSPGETGDRRPRESGSGASDGDGLGGRAPSPFWRAEAAQADQYEPAAADQSVAVGGGSDDT